LVAKGREADHGPSLPGAPREARRFWAKDGRQARRGLRRDLQRVFGLEEWQEKGFTWKRAERKLTARERELFEDTPFTRPVDFHSWRRAYSQALAVANVSSQQAQALAGHASLDAHSRYLNNTAKMRAAPLDELPKILVLPRSVPKLSDSRPDRVLALGSQKAKSPEVSCEAFQLRGGATRTVYRDHWGLRGGWWRETEVSRWSWALA
jgi:hypothetical protein